MNNINHRPVADDLSDTSNDTAVVTPHTVQKIVLAVALLTSAMSLGIAVFGGMQRAGTVTEQVWSVGVSVGAVLCMYLVPMLWRYVNPPARIITGALWLAALYAVLTGQMDVLAQSHQHAADQRAQAVPVDATPSVVDVSRGRGLTTITQDIAKVNIDLVHVEAQRCVGECRGLHARKATLSAQLVALNAEASEAKRFETEQDWLRDQAAKAEAMRDSRRANPATSQVAHWLGTTEARLELLRDFIYVVVLEGTACFAWYFAGLGLVALDRAAIVDDKKTVLQSQAVVSVPEPQQDGRDWQVATHTATLAEGEAVVNDASAATATSDDDRLVAEIHEAVVAGKLRRDLASIRKFLRCGQPKAIRVNRLYVERFGKAHTPTGAGAVGAA
jgi:hypothetical protein